MARNSTKDMTVGSPFKLVISFTLPLLLGLLFQQLYSFVDTAIVGKYLGSASLAAVGSTGSLNFLLLGFCMGICSGCTIPVAQAFGAKDETELRRCVVHCVYLGAVMSLVMAVLTTVLCRWMLVITNTPAEILEDAIAYIRPIFTAIPITVLYNMSSGIMRSLGDSKTPVYFVILAALLNVVLDLVFILVFHLGVAGAAYATNISQLVAGVGCLIVLIRKFPILKIQHGDTAFRPELARRLLGMGLPMGLQYSITAIGSVMLQSAINGLGTIAVAAVTAGGKLSGFFTCVFDALATTMATFAGQNIGAKKLDRVHEGVKAASVIGLIYCVLAVSVVLLFGNQMIQLFVDASETQVIQQARDCILIYTLFYAPLLFVNVLRLTIQGLGYARIAMLAGVMELAARALAALLVPVFGFYGACMGGPIAWIFADLFLFPCYFSITRKLRSQMYQAGENH